ncbi:Two-component transcriptional response regulator, LuxR family [hydrothermal vent metagenome]|uniref:Two-component transcriptional response regulator, LuxR family n=1 Tax=hydrothermal vent metagenome TaxID=652676 RepID=A0A3B1CFX3_9ZZZZ
MKKILVVDDQKDNVFVLQERLSREGFEVLASYDGPTCLTMAKEEDPDLVLLDVMMPGMSGFEVCRKLTSSEDTKLIPVVLLTALTEAEDLKEGFEAGAFDYIKKPFNRVELIARIKSALSFRESQKVMLEIEKVQTYAATVITANHEIKQPLTLINLSTAAINRELRKDELSKDVVQKRVTFIEEATKEIISVLQKLSSIKVPVLTNWVNDLKVVDLSKAKTEEDKLEGRVPDQFDH